MIRITKEESVELHKKYPDIYITIVNRQSNHKKYWAPEDKRVLYFLDKLRNRKFAPKKGVR